MKRISAPHTKPVAPFPHWHTTDVELLEVTEKCLSFSIRSCAPVAATWIVCKTVWFCAPSKRRLWERRLAWRLPLGPTKLESTWDKPVQFSFFVLFCFEPSCQHSRLKHCVEIFKETRRNALRPAFVNTCPLGVALLSCQWRCCTTVQPHYLSRKASNELDEKGPLAKEVSILMDLWGSYW